MLLSSFLEKAVAPHSSTLAWRIPWMEEPGGLQSMGPWESDTTERLHFHFSLSCIGEGNGNPRQCSCLENPRDRGAWWAAIYGVAQSRTRLKWRSSSSSKFILQIKTAKEINYITQDFWDKLKKVYLCYFYIWWEIYMDPVRMRLNFLLPTNMHSYLHISYFSPAFLLPTVQTIVARILSMLIRL